MREPPICLSRGGKEGTSGLYHESRSFRFASHSLNQRGSVSKSAAFLTGGIASISSSDSTLSPCVTGTAASAARIISSSVFSDSALCCSSVTSGFGVSWNLLRETAARSRFHSPCPFNGMLEASNDSLKANSPSATSSTISPLSLLAILDATQQSHATPRLGLDLVPLHLVDRRLLQPVLAPLHTALSAL